MHVLVTGGTGFVGAHIVQALLRDVHEVRVLARDAARAAPALSPLGVDPNVVEVEKGDVLDADAVRAAVAGCDAVVHAAAVFSLDARDAETMRGTNAAAAELVLGAAAHSGADPIVHVSSSVALQRVAGSTLSGDSPQGDLDGSYPESKRASDVVARRMQADGGNVVRVHPAGMFGPDDPHLGVQARLLRDILMGRYPMWPKGRTFFGDVRDAADTVAAVVATGGGGRSAWLAPSWAVSGGDLYGTLGRITGRRLRFLSTPVWVTKPLLLAAAPVVRLLPQRISVPLPTAAGAGLFASGNAVDDAVTLGLAGVSRRTLEESLTDTVRWLVAAGHLAPKKAGALGS